MEEEKLEKIELKIDKNDEKKNKIIKNEKGVYHDGKTLLYEPDRDLELKSCCGLTLCNIEKPLLEILLKFIVSASVLSFSMYQLGHNRGDSSFFASTISLILGIYINTSREEMNRLKKK